VDDTVDRAHDVGAVIYPVFTATDANHANELVSKYANAGSVVYQGSGTPGTFTELAVGTAGQALKVNAGATAPEWGQLAAAGIADGAVTSAKILDGTIVLGDLAAALQAFLVPVGTINAYAGATAPTGYLLCDGTSTTGYAALAALVGATTPDMRGLFPIGKTASSTGSTLLGTGGSTTIAEANLPVHSHANTAAFTGSSVNTGSTDPSHTHTYNEPAFSTRSLQTGSVSITLSSGTFTPNTSTNSSAAHTHTVTAAGTVAMTNASTGSGTAYFQPFIAVNYIIKHD
jgi:microcystin-dependent protein